jgi:ketosteroid isomerase-like protein
VNLSEKAIRKILTDWFRAWDDHDLNGVMVLFHDDVFFENWTGGRARGREALRKAWSPWFEDHGNFKFIEEDIFIDVAAQKALYRWTLEWPSRERGFEGGRERRRGVDVLHFRNGKIIKKLTYCKTVIEIEGTRVSLRASHSDESGAGA